MKLINAFDAVDENGKQETLHVYADMVPQATKDNPQAAPRIGVKTVVTSDGVPCNRIDDDTFQVLSSDRILRRVTS